MWFKLLTQGSLGQHCGGVGTSQSLGFISASGTPQWYRSWLLCSLLLVHGASSWQAEDERREKRGIFLFGWMFFLAMHSWQTFPGQFQSMPPTSLTFAKCLTEPGSHNGVSGGCRSQMQQANTACFPRSQTQQRRQEEKQTSWCCSTSFLLL